MGARSASLAMPRTFNTTGPCEPDRHYMLPAEGRLPDLLPLVEERLYFVVHAPRQTGKTTAMRAFAARLRAGGYAAVHATLEESQGVEATEEAEPIWMTAIARAAQAQLDATDGPPEPLLAGAVGTRLGAWLAAWAERLAPRQVVLLLDEADVVTGPALVSLLRQLRAGFLQRPARFPASVALVGMRELRDYLATAKDGSPVSPGSPFNIKAGSFTLRNFTAEEIAALYGQHTAETGQPFTEEAIARAWAWTQGQPFLVNALGRRVVMEERTDRGLPIDGAAIDAAVRWLAQSRTTHLYSLAERLREPRVARIVSAVLTGDQSVPYRHDDFQYVVDLGLVVKGPDGAEIANPLYREVLARELTTDLQENLPRPRWRWLDAQGRLDFPTLVDQFLGWWRENADALGELAPGYPEALPHLAFMAFLQKVVNGGGEVRREYAAGRRALDLVVIYGPDRFVVELKRVRARDALDAVRRAGVEQTLAYLDALGEREGWLILFDQRPRRTWKQRLWAETLEQDGHRIHLRGA